MRRTAVLNVVGLSKDLLGAYTPNINHFIERGKITSLRPMLPAVTCAVQSTYLTGKEPSVHGIVGNGWYDRSDNEVKFWKQSNTLVQAPGIWHELQREFPKATCANLFWWFNMNSGADISVTPRPVYTADGRKIPDIYTNPPTLRDTLQRSLGRFPLFNFWGPATSIVSSQWISEASKKVEEQFKPTLCLIYLPHLDYNLQRLGKDTEALAKDLRDIDKVVGDLISFYTDRDVSILLLSEYGIDSVHHPIHLNRHFRERGWLKVREELGREILDTGASLVFAVADHQIAHIYVKDKNILGEVADLVGDIQGVHEVLGVEGKRRYALDHERSGDLISVAKPDAWFTYYYWLEDSKAPDFARTVDIHRKPGYDPVEMFLDKTKKGMTLRISWKLFRKALGFRTIMNVIPLDASLIKGSHGISNGLRSNWPILAGGPEAPIPDHDLAATDVQGIILGTVRGA